MQLPGSKGRFELAGGVSKQSLCQVLQSPGPLGGGTGPSSALLYSAPLPSMYPCYTAQRPNQEGPSPRLQAKKGRVGPWSGCPWLSQPPSQRLAILKVITRMGRDGGGGWNCKGAHVCCPWPLHAFANPCMWKCGALWARVTREGTVWAARRPPVQGLCSCPVWLRAERSGLKSNLQNYLREARERGGTRQAPG